MVRAFRQAHGAGYRAGRAPRRLQVREDGTKVLIAPVCPYTGRWQALQRFAWGEGLRTGTMEQLEQRLKAGKRG